MQDCIQLTVRFKKKKKCKIEKKNLHRRTDINIHTVSYFFQLIFIPMFTEANTILQMKFVCFYVLHFFCHVYSLIKLSTQQLQSNLIHLFI